MYSHTLYSLLRQQTHHKVTTQVTAHQHSVIVYGCVARHEGHVDGFREGGGIVVVLVLVSLVQGRKELDGSLGKDEHATRAYGG
jgi:hypothetical protein